MLANHLLYVHIPDEGHHCDERCIVGSPYSKVALHQRYGLSTFTI